MSKVLIIAEAGVNHNGSIENAFKLVDAAVQAGVDFVKFQTFKAENLVSRNARKAKYQIGDSRNLEESQFDMLKKLELSKEQHEELIDYCNHKNIKFFSTAFDLDSLEYLEQIGLKIVKIPSGEITNLPYLMKAASLFKEVIISTGMSTMEEIKASLQIFLDAGIERNKITVLHCNTEYPTPMKDVNLKAMLSIQKELEVKIGYSDHTLGIEVPIAAVALGATIIEKHFTLDKSMEGPDHGASLEPQQLIEMCKAIRNIEAALSGSGLKEPSASERKNMDVSRKSIIAKVFIKEGDKFTEDNITVKRPGTGINPMLWKDVLDRIAKKDFEQDSLIEI